MPKVLSDEAVEHFHSQGFLSPVPVLSPEEVAHFRGCLERFEAKYPDDVKKLKSKSHLLCPWVEDIARHPGILDVYEDLIGPNILCYSMAFRIKDPDGRTHAGWHQDGAYNPIKPILVIGALALAECTVAHGCLKVIPGSHKTGVLPHEDTGNPESILSRGQYITADIDEATLPAGAAQTVGDDPTNATVLAGLSVDAGTDGYQLQGTLTGHVFQDTDGDGTQDVGEPDLAGVDVVINPSTGPPVTVATDASGNWSAADLPAGAATVDVDESTMAPGATLTAGTDPTNVTVVAAASTDAGTDGYQLQGTLTGHVFQDDDGDGTQDAGEPDLAGVDVVITDSQSGSHTVTTDASGDWSATGVPGGMSSVDVDEATLEELMGPEG